MPPAPPLFKDAPPEATIARATSILRRLGLEVKEWNHFEWRNLLFALSVEVVPARSAQWPITTHGKGVTEEAARASAYAELLERLQALALPGALPTSYGLMPGPHLGFHDCVNMRLDEYRAADPHLAGDLYGEAFIASHGQRSIELVPYLDLFANHVALVPDEMVYWRCLSNGLCAGNTPEEALVQGLCEVFERYIGRCLFLDGRRVPRVSPDLLRDAFTRNLLLEIEGAGFTVSLYDCSLGIGLPVIGVTITNRSGFSHFHLGSDPDLSVAVLRCLTETLQSTGAAAFAKEGGSHRMVPLRRDEDKPGARDRQRAYYGYYRHSDQNLPPGMLSEDWSAKTLPFLETQRASSRARLRFALERMQALGVRLLIRDLGYLGFPSYRVYVPGMSEIFPMSGDDVLTQLALCDLPELRQTVLRLATPQSSDVLRRALERLAAIVMHPRFPASELGVRWNVNWAPDSNLSFLGDGRSVARLLAQKIQGDRDHVPDAVSDAASPFVAELRRLQVLPSE